MEICTRKIIMKLVRSVVQTNLYLSTVGNYKQKIY